MFSEQSRIENKFELNRVDYSKNSSGSVTYYFSHHEYSWDASDKGHVHHNGDVSRQPSEAVAPLLRALGVGGAGLRGNLGREVCHDHAAYLKMGVSETATATTNSSRA